MRSNLFALTLVLALAACGKSAPIESAEALADNPERLKELQARCHADRTQVGEAQCVAVADAVRKRFMRPMPSPYANDPVQPRKAL